MLCAPLLSGSCSAELQLAWCGHELPASESFFMVSACYWRWWYWSAVLCACAVPLHTSWYGVCLLQEKGIFHG